jgi:hypothetical protein
MPHDKFNAYYRIPKRDLTLEECADQYDVNIAWGRFAIADGVTVSTMPELWAHNLVKVFCYGTDDNLDKIPFALNDWPYWLDIARKCWIEDFNHKLPLIDPFMRTMHENSIKKNEGARSTFVGLEFDIRERTWQAIIVGDCCLFHLESGKLKASYIPKQFNNFPLTFHSLPTDSKPEPEIISGILTKETVFFMASDAVAEWILRKYESEGETIFYTLRTLENDMAFQALIESARDDSDIQLKDDDTTLLIIKPSRSVGLMTNSPKEEFVKNSKSAKVSAIQLGLFAALALLLSVLMIYAAWRFGLGELNQQSNLVSTTNQPVSSPTSNVPVESPSPSVLNGNESNMLAGGVEGTELATLASITPTQPLIQQ